MSNAKDILERTIISGKCLIWKGAKNDSGYGVKKIDGKFWYVHRYIWFYHNGKIPDGFDIDHVCFNRACVSLSHLKSIPKKENRKRWKVSRRKVKCLRGHSIYYPKKGRGVCRICSIIHVQNCYKRNGRK